MKPNQPTNPVHVPGTMRGEELVIKEGCEPGREAGQRAHRVARDSTGIAAKGKGPIDPRMPHIPPA